MRLEEEEGRTIGPSLAPSGVGRSTAVPEVLVGVSGPIAVPQEPVEAGRSAVAPKVLTGAGGSTAAPMVPREGGGSAAVPPDTREASPLA